MNSPDISVIVTFHREGRLAHVTLNSLARCITHAAQEGLKVEMICTLDKADQYTQEYVCRHPTLKQNDKIISLDNGDLATSRNQAIEQASGSFIAICDGDDLYSGNWLCAAHRFCQNTGERVVAHPAITVSFGAMQGFTHTVDQTSERFDPDSLLMTNYWCSCVFAERELFTSHPYHPMHTPGSPDGFGFEDWHWNCETVASGILHRAVPQTALFYRRKGSASLNHSQQARNVQIPASRLFAS